MTNHGSLLVLMHSVSLLVHVLSQSPVCFWGDTSYEATTYAMNGLYSYSGEHNEKPYYTKANETCHQIYYMYYVASPYYAWDIYNSLDDKTDSAHCEPSNTSHPITSCSEWQVWDGGDYKTDSNVFTRLNSCPSWNCDQISIPSLPNECNATFDEYVGDNTWTNSLNGLYWYFNPLYFRWECHNTSPDVCKDSPLAYTNPGWTDVPNGTGSVDYTFAAPNTNSYTVNCIVIPPSTSPTSFPSKAPSKSPTALPSTAPSGPPSSSPSGNPSISPTDNPSKSPSKTPSKSPTILPTSAPSRNPSISPTNNPSNSPSKTPSKSPTDLPSKSPTTLPTSAPSRNPSVPPTDNPSTSPSEETSNPSVTPSSLPTNVPSRTPTYVPSEMPSVSPITLPPTYKPSRSPLFDHASDSGEDRGTVINITVIVTDSIAMNDVIHSVNDTIFSYLLAKGITTPLQTDIITRGTTIIAIYGFENDLDSDDVNAKAIEAQISQELDDTYQGNTKVKVDVSNARIEDKDSAKNDEEGVQPMVWIMIGIGVFAVFAIVMIYCSFRRRKPSSLPPGSGHQEAEMVQPMASTLVMASLPVQEAELKPTISNESMYDVGPATVGVDITDGEAGERGSVLLVTEIKAAQVTQKEEMLDSSDSDDGDVYTQGQRRTIEGNTKGANERSADEESQETSDDEDDLDKMYDRKSHKTAGAQATKGVEEEIIQNEGAEDSDDDDNTDAMYANPESGSLSSKGKMTKK